MKLQKVITNKQKNLDFFLGAILKVTDDNSRIRSRIC